MDYALEKLNSTDLDGRKIRLVEEKRSSRRSRSASRSRYFFQFCPVQEGSLLASVGSGKL
jgi:hypothetical protein